MSRVSKRKVELEEDKTSEEDTSFDRNEKGLSSVKNQKVKEEKDDEDLGRGKRPRKTYSETQRKEYEEELADEYEMLPEMNNCAIEESLKSAKTNFDAGQILEIEMKDFMCHRRFTVKLGRRLNFIVGKNGSGKSAIATALQLCLGATARNTGRGSALSTFIREGSNGPASVKVTLVNEGADAYMPEVYGNRIVIERRIHKGTGAGGYHLYNEEKKEVSTKKEDLEKILRCFNIYVDNPVCCLTQEESKKFVFGKDTDKYEFFLKATGLFNLFDDLMKIKSELEDTEKLKNQEESKLGLKRENIEDLQDKIEKFLKLQELETEIQVSTAKILWDNYRTEKEKLTNKEREIAVLNAERDKSQKEFDKLSATETSSTEEIAALSESVDSKTKEQRVISDTIIEKSNELKILQGKWTQLKSCYNEEQSNLKQHEQSVRDITQEVSLMILPEYFTLLI
jgi:chromosome segregation ATPase